MIVLRLEKDQLYRLKDVFFKREQSKENHQLDSEISNLLLSAVHEDPHGVARARRVAENVFGDGTIEDRCRGGCSRGGDGPACGKKGCQG